MKEMYWLTGSKRSEGSGSGKVHPKALGVTGTPLCLLGYSGLCSAVPVGAVPSSDGMSSLRHIFMPLLSRGRAKCICPRDFIECAETLIRWQLDCELPPWSREWSYGPWDYMGPQWKPGLIEEGETMLVIH